MMAGKLDCYISVSGLNVDDDDDDDDELSSSTSQLQLNLDRHDSASVVHVPQADHHLMLQGTDIDCHTIDYCPAK